MAAGKSRHTARHGRTTPKPPPPGWTGASDSAPTSAGQSSPGALHATRDSGVRRNDGGRGAFAALAIGLLVAVCYMPATMGGFVWDDFVFRESEAIQHLYGLRQIWLAPRSLNAGEGHYWPILYTTLWLEHKLWGFNPVGYHVINLVLHMAVTLVLWRLLLRLAVPGAWAVAAVFAVHPLHVESVAWVIGRKDLLAALFYLTCVLSYLRFVEDGRRSHYVQALTWFVLSLLSKTTAVTLPASLLIWHWWHRGRVTVADAARVAPFLLAGLAIMIPDLLYYKNIDSTAFDYSLIERALIAAHALWFYVGKLVWPTELAVMYPRWAVGTGNPLAWGYVMAALVAAALLWLFRHRTGRGALAGTLFFAVTLSPTLGFVDYGYMLFSFVADRYQYLAGAGMIAVLVGAAAHGTSRLPGTWRTGVQAMAVVPLVVLGTLTWHQSGIYRDNVTFYRHIISLNPEARFAHLSLGMEYHRQQRYEDAFDAYQAEYRLALAQRPQDQYRISSARLGLGAIAEKQGRLEEAVAYYKGGLTLQDTFNRLTALLLRQKRYQEALELYQEFSQKNPGSATLHSGMGVALVGLNRPNEALRSFERALALDPSLDEARAYRDHVLTFLKSRGQ